MSLIAQLRHTIIAHAKAVAEEAGHGDVNTLPWGSIALEVPRDASHGELATNAALVLAKPLRLAPRAIAERVLARMQGDGHYRTLQIEGPGFINMRLHPQLWQQIIRDILANPFHYGHAPHATNRQINLEYVSVNPTGPMHVGHARGAVYGDVLANLLTVMGHEVTREYYINDAGNQIDILTRSAFIRYQEACGIVIEAIPEGLYPGDYLVPVGQALYERYGRDLLAMPEAEWLELIKPQAVDAMMALIKADLASIGVHHHVFTSERFVRAEGYVDRAFAMLKEKGCIYHGILPPPKGGNEGAEWNAQAQWLFKSTDFGDDIDRALQRPDGGWSYFAADFGYALHKIERGFDALIMVIGMDHKGYVTRMKALYYALMQDINFSIELYDLVRFMKGGEPLKMSKRSGHFLSVQEVVEDIGKDAMRFTLLTRTHDVPMDFDFDLVQQQSKDNPVFYVQYAHARVHSILRHAAESMPMEEGACDLTLLSSDQELAIMRHMAMWPECLQHASDRREPHHLAHFLIELASHFHAWWNAGKDNEQHRFIRPQDVPLSQARITLVKAVGLLIANGLSICGVTAPEEML